jgi:hypothetical protein
MLMSILSDRPMGPGSGWFGPSQSAYGWKWMVERFDANRDGAITPREFRGARSLFARLDRDRDGRLTQPDFDWSPRSPIVQRERMADMLFRRTDRDTNGRISAAEWQALFKQATRGKDAMTPEELQQLLFPPTSPRPTTPVARASGMPSKWTLLRGLFTGEIGSMCEGPSIGEKAPGFTLRSHHGKRTVSLSDYQGKKPVVLIFGSFT